MATTVLYMSMSLDGFITGPNVRPDNGLGDTGQRLHDWVFPEGVDDDFDTAAPKITGVNKLVYDEVLETRAVIAGRRTFEPAGGWDGDHHDGIPIHILSRHPRPEWTAGWANVHYGPDLGALVRRARDAAGDGTVLVHGSSIAQRMLVDGLLDELEIHLVPVLLGDGIRLFEHLGVEPRELERERVLEGEGGVVHLHYRVAR